MNKILAKRQLAYLALADRINELARIYGGIRGAARATRVDAGYLCRLRDGSKKEPSAATLRKLALERVVLYKVR